ncbi:Phosphotransferase enzyme [Ophidiomyces ophidiicola]|nr:Phosphotransferase enzyme [Ophidiomyces ophidiicola]
MLANSQRHTRSHLTAAASVGSQYPSDHTFFKYTSGRWLWDEANQLRKRYQPFNVQQLKDIAASSVNAATCTQMVKLPEGAYNKAFLLTMDNGVQIVARIPNPYLPPRIATASEVATLDFLRNELDIPVPRVLAWSGEKDQPVGTEYIIMEKAQGEELGKTWLSMGIPEKVDLVSQMVRIQANICFVDFKYYGSLYYRGETNGYHNIPGVPSRFCIGPSAALQFWEAERRHMGSSPVSYAEGIANREMDWIRRFAKPRNVSDPLRQSTSQESPSSHIHLLEKYLKILPDIIPSGNELSRATLWHSDLHLGNIFVENSKIVSIIDWQDCMSLPLFVQSKIPKFLRSQGPRLFDLPPAAGLTENEKQETFLRYQLSQLQGFYVSKFQYFDSDIFQTLSDPHATIRQQLIDFAGSTWEDDGLFIFKQMMHQVWQNWNELVGDADRPCPIAFSPHDISLHEVEKNAWDDYRELFSSLDIPIDGWVHSQDFRAKAETLQNLARETLASADNKDEVRQALNAWKLTNPESTNP